VLLAFQESIVDWKHSWQIELLTRLVLAGFQMLLVQLREICCPIGAKKLNLPVFKRLLAKIEKLSVLLSYELLNSI
jgi:hypothetical protein